MILILTAGFGDGHNTAARSVARALQRLAPDEPQQIVDVIDLAHPVLSPWLKWGYQVIITRLPRIWKRMYDGSAKVKFERGRFDIVTLVRASLSDLVRKTKPRAIITTYPLYPQLLQQIRGDGIEIPPWFTVVTDSITIHPVWTLAASAGYFVADEDSKKAIVALGAPAEKVSITGFPVSLDFVELAGVPRPASPHGRVLYMPSTRAPHVEQTLEELRPLLQRGLRLTLVLAKHYERLYQTVRRFNDSMPGADIEVLPWTNQIPQLLHSHDFVICKAGGAILHEALAAECPAIIDYVIPGQEEGNAELLVLLGCGIVSRTPQATGDIAKRLLADGGAEARRMREKAINAGVPRAALNVVESVLKQL